MTTKPYFLNETVKASVEADSTLYAMWKATRGTYDSDIEPMHRASWVAEKQAEEATHMEHLQTIVMSGALSEMDEPPETLFGDQAQRELNAQEDARCLEIVESTSELGQLKARIEALAVRYEQQRRDDTLYGGTGMAAQLRSLVKPCEHVWGSKVNGPVKCSLCGIMAGERA